MLFKVTNIEWDCDGENPEMLGLPIKEARVESDSIENVIDDLSDERGFLISHVDTIEMWSYEKNDWVDVSNE